MSNYAVQTPEESSELYLGEKPLGRGGEGSVFEVKDHAISSLLPADEIVAKIYHNPDEDDRARKVVAMIRNTPDSDSLAWPLALVLENGKFAGYVMRKLPKQSYRMWAELAHAQQRRSSAEKFDVRYALTAALNCALTLDAVHEAGHAVGDVNESNIFIGNDASVLLVDTDSAQIRNGDKLYPCLVGKPEYTAAELTHGSLKEHLRTPATDVFAYAVAVYQLLTGGAHPMDGVFEGEGEPPSVVEKIRNGVTPNLSKTRGFSPVRRVPTGGIPSTLRALILRAMSVDPSKRPELCEFEEEVDAILDRLQHCSKVKQHWFDSRDKKCGWCQHVKDGQPDPWVPQELNVKKAEKKTQKKLPQIKFKDETVVKKAPRVKMAPSVNTPPGGSSSVGTTAALPSSHRPGSSMQQPLSQVYKTSRIELPKVKGKTVLSYADGSRGERPALGLLFQSNSKLAYQCFVNEVPDVLRPSWRFGDEMLPRAPFMVSVVLGLFCVVAWFFGTPLIFAATPLKQYPMFMNLVPYISYVAAGCSAVFVLLKTFFTLHEERKIMKIAGQYNVPQRSVVSTFFPLPVGAVFYGLPFLVVSVTVLVFTVVGALIDSASKDLKK